MVPFSSGRRIESGGVLTAGKNPGVDIGLVPGFSLDISNVGVRGARD